MDRSSSRNKKSRVRFRTRLIILRSDNRFWVLHASREQNDKRNNGENPQKNRTKNSAAIGHSPYVGRAINEMRDPTSCVIKPSCASREMVSRDHDAVMDTTASVMMAAESASVEASAVEASS